MGQSTSSEEFEEPLTNTHTGTRVPLPNRDILATSRINSQRGGSSQTRQHSNANANKAEDNDDCFSAQEELEETLQRKRYLDALTEHRSNVNQRSDHIGEHASYVHAITLDDDESLTFNEGSDSSSMTESFNLVVQDFHPVLDPNWMFRSIETLVLGQRSAAPILALLEDKDNISFTDDCFTRRRSTASTFGGFNNRRGSLAQPGFQGGTLASYFRRATRRSSSVGAATSTCTVRRRRSSNVASVTQLDTLHRAPPSPIQHASNNVILKLYAREHLPGRRAATSYRPPSQSLRSLGGTALVRRLDGPASGIVSEVSFLSAALDNGDWSETQAIVSRLVKRLVGGHETINERDPNLPPQASKFYAGGGRYGLERDAFCLAGGVESLFRIFQEKFVVGEEVAKSGDARDLSPSTVAIRLSSCWNETLGTLRELVYFMPFLVQNDHWNEFLPFLFTLLTHDTCFDHAAALIEEVLSALSQQRDSSTFFLGSIPNVHKLWQDFRAHHLCLFCRILALLVFEPEDRALLESPSALQSLDLLQLRRNRAARRDPTVDMNQSLVLGDRVLLKRLVKLLSIMNYAPPLRRFAPYHILSRHPFVADTLVMLGLDELTDWGHIDRLDSSARTLIGNERSICNVGKVAGMLEKLNTQLEQSNGPQNEPLHHILNVIQAAQEAGVVSQRIATATSPIAGRNNAALVTLAGIADHFMAQHLFMLRSDQNFNQENNQASVPLIGSIANFRGTVETHVTVSPYEAANILQFNALMLSSFQVEVLFVLCTLLGGRRKIDAQDSLSELQLIPILEEMFDRLPWASQDNETDQSDGGPEQPNGIHGPNCECTPESALCIQYMRLIHNFCDRDHKNYYARSFLLSQSEQNAIRGKISRDKAIPGLLSKLTAAFVEESDESSYRFWLASCIESFLRGSSESEQRYMAEGGLLNHLLKEICTDKLHCSGNLQTTFDLLGELIKGNPQVMHAMTARLDETTFRKLMLVATTNLVDSNVFIRSAFLSIERIASIGGGTFLPLDYYHHEPDWSPPYSQLYLSHSWFDNPIRSLYQNSHDSIDDSLSMDSDWFPNKQQILTGSQAFESFCESMSDWSFVPKSDVFSPETYLPNTIERLGWFLVANQSRLLRRLLDVVNLQNINHENICCVNTAVVIVMFAHRRKQLPGLIQELKQIDNSRNSLSGSSYDCRALRFRQLLWFWQEYYGRRGRDRLSLEFSSHVRFHEWESVVGLLTSDDSSPCSLLNAPMRLPRSPYQRAATIDMPRRR